VSKFTRYIWGTLSHPAATFRDLSREENVKQGWGAVLLVGVLCSVVCAIATVNGIEPVVEPFLPISKVSFYFWEIFFAPLVMIGAWYLFSYLNLCLGRALGGKGTFKAVLMPLGFAFCIPMLPIMWTTDFICITFTIDLRTLGTFGRVWNVFYQTFTILWMAVACVIATREAHRISLGKATAATLISVIPAVLIIAATIR
jgi:hypothetical protein